MSLTIWRAHPRRSVAWRDCGEIRGPRAWWCWHLYVLRIPAQAGVQAARLVAISCLPVTTARRRPI